MARHSLEKNLDLAKERYGELGVDVETAMNSLEEVHLSLPCWQGDDVGGFETSDAVLTGGGILATGNYPGKPRTVEELRKDLEFAFSLIPGSHRLNLHASYGDFDGKLVDRDRIEKEHFRSWVDWARKNMIGLDFNATLFSHPLAESNFTLSSNEEGIRRFWREHVIRCREIGAWIGRELGSPCLHNLWIPDGSKDLTVTRLAHRELLLTSLDRIFSVKYPQEELKDSVEGKLFGIGSESYVVGSYDFYLAWAVSNGVLLCLDMGHFHPTESVADKISALLPFVKELVLHLSRGVRWDSDHVVLKDDDLVSLAQEIVRANALTRVHIGLDFFDASINRIGAWVIGARAALIAFLYAVLEPVDLLREMELAGDFFGRLALLEELKGLPFGVVWDWYCAKMDVPIGREWILKIRDHENRVLSNR